MAQSLKEMLAALGQVVELAERAARARVDGSTATEANIRVECVNIVASYIVTAREIRGRDELFERALWREILDRAEMVERHMAEAKEARR